MLLFLLHLKSFNIFDQLKIEEALLRKDNKSWCIINEGTPPAIVMGISGKPHLLLKKHLIEKDKICVIRRFSGGGCVVVDENTIFITFIFASDLFPIKPYPKSIMKWSEQFYKESLALPSFRLEENDYVIGNHKCAGSAQYIQKKRWLHHTSFLWDYEKRRMNYLLIPTNTPRYRKERSHLEFLSPLSKHFICKEQFIEKVERGLKKNFSIYPTPLKEALKIAQLPYRSSTKYI